MAATIDANTSSVDVARAATDAFFALNNPPAQQLVDFAENQTADFVYLAAAPSEALGLANMENQVETIGLDNDGFYAVA